MRSISGGPGSEAQLPGQRNVGGGRLQMDQAAGDLALGEVAIPVVHRLELAAVDRDALALQRADTAAEFDELGAGPADDGTIVAPEADNGLVVGDQLAGQP